MKCTTQEQGHAPKEGPPLRIFIDTRGGYPIHHKGDNIKRRKIAHTPELGINKIENDLAKGLQCAKKLNKANQTATNFSTQ